MEALLKSLEADAKKYLNEHIYVVRVIYPFRLKIQDIVQEVLCANQKCVEYTVQRDLYPGYKGDNVSLFTGKYYIYDTSSEKYIVIDGAPSYLDELKKRLSGFKISFIEGIRTQRTCVCILRIEKED